MSNIQIQPEPFYDSLSIAHKLDNNLDSFRLEEIHLFSYFSAILFLYKGNTTIEWGYKFICDKEGYPFADELDSAIDRHLKNGLFDKQGEFFEITSRGTDEFNKFKGLSTFKIRENYLDAACTTTILIPYSQTIRALLNDPEINKKKESSNKQWLDQSVIYKRFKEISEAVGVPTADLIIPAVTWVNYIIEKERQNSNKGL